MTKRATMVKKRATSRANGAGSSLSVAGEAAARREIPIDLAPLLAPYKGRGRLTLRIEHMPQLARLSAGRNNGDNSWSLASDELEDLVYLPPRNLEKVHDLIVRIIVHDEYGASSIAAVDFPVSPDAAKLEPPPEALRASDSRAVWAENAKLRDDLAQASTALAALESELAEMTERAEAHNETKLAEEREIWKFEAETRIAEAVAQATAEAEKGREAWQAEHDARIAEIENLARKQMEDARKNWQRESDAALEKTKEAWKSEEAYRLSAAEKRSQQKGDKALAQAHARAEAVRSQSETELRRLQDELAAAQDALTAREAELVQMRAEAKRTDAHLQKEIQAALSKAQEDWKTSDDARLAAAQAQWRQQSAAAAAELTARCERAETALAEARAKANAMVPTDHHKAELNHLRDGMAQLEKNLTERDAELSQMRAQSEREKTLAQQKATAALSKAHDDWTAAEASRLATAQAQWHEQSATMAAELRARCERAEAALAEERAQADTRPPPDDHEGELHRQRDEIAALQKIVADRDAELAQVRLTSEQVSQQRMDAALSSAEETWKTAEASRLAEAKAQWHKQTDAEAAELMARCERAEAALAEVRAQAANAPPSGDHEGEVHRLRDEITVLQATLGDRDTELARIRLALEQAEHASGDEADTAIANARSAWKTDEAARLAAAEARWKAHYTEELEIATSRYQAAEQALADLRRRNGGQMASSAGDLRDELATLQRVLADREAELARARSALGYVHQQDLQPTDRSQATAQSGRGLIRDIALVVSVVMVAILFYPRIIAMLPDEWRAEIGTLVPALVSVGDGTSSVGQEVPRPAPRPANGNPTATVVHGVNLRASPSATSAVIGTVQHGVEVTIIRQDGNWTFVRMHAGNGHAKSQQGWIYNSFLKAKSSTGKSPPGTKRG